MIDIHCHIIPGYQDGPLDMEEALLMGRWAERDGITDLMATPFIADGSTPTRVIQHHVDMLNEHFVDAGIDIRIHRGADICCTLAPEHVSGHTLAGSDFMLLEFPLSYFPLNTREIVFAYVVAGFEPIITHPERNASLMRDPGPLLSVLETGGYVQLSAQSLIGGFGADARECARHLLKLGVVDFIASDSPFDAYPREDRPALLSEALDVASSVIGPSAAQRLVIDNPRSVLNGEGIVRR